MSYELGVTSYKLLATGCSRFVIHDSLFTKKTSLVSKLSGFLLHEDMLEDYLAIVW
jgi:hypothetical protein